MPYTKTNWIDGVTEITPARLRNLESQYDEVVSEWETNPFKMDGTKPLEVEVRASAPDHAAGRIYYNTTTEALLASDGTTWIDLTAIGGL